MLRALIVDDERLARQKIRTFLDARDDVGLDCAVPAELLSN